MYSISYLIAKIYVALNSYRTLPNVEHTFSTYGYYNFTEMEYAHLTLSYQLTEANLTLL